MRPARTILFVAALASLALVAGLVPRFGSQDAARTLRCPAGYTVLASLDSRDAGRVQGGSEAERSGALAHSICLRKDVELPEGMSPDLGSAAAGGTASAAAYRAALAQASQLPTKSGRWVPVGKGPMMGLADLGERQVEGRPTDLDYVAKTDQLYASISYGGVWRSDDHGKTWHSIGEGLPTQIVGSVKYSSAGGGTLIALTGDNSFGHDSQEGLGAYWSNNGGKRWHHSKGIPDGLFGFKVAVDHTHPNIVYAATGGGLFRSTDTGRSFVNVKLPTGPCAGKPVTQKPCLLANQVTDVVVEEPGGITHAKGGAVVAAVGWRAGAHQNPDGSAQAPANGLYGSSTGAPGTFTMLTAPGFAPQQDVGRVEMGQAVGPQQDHGYLYAVVQSAQLRTWNDYAPSVDVPLNPVGADTSLKVPTVLDGIYVSSDFGQTWRLMSSGLELQEPTTGSSLAIVEQALGRYGPGSQSWYDQFIEPDPTHQLPGVGIPTRVAFGLEEVWDNIGTQLPQAGKSQFQVIGRYFAGTSCLALGPLVTGAPYVCPVNGTEALTPTTTTHPDQHTAVWIPEKNGGVTLVVGNDGGIFTQTVSKSGQLDNAHWGDGANIGFNTLLPYQASIANDGTVWMGLQDNGTARIDPKTGQQQEMLGGDGFITAVDPRNSKTAYGEYTFAAMSSTTDSGKTWSSMTPPITDTHFSNPFVMDPQDANHLLTAGRQAVETVSGPGTGADGWIKVFDLGTMKHPGSSSATSDPANDPGNSASAVAVNGPNAYVGFCGPESNSRSSPCDILNSPFAFYNGLATNVGGSKKPVTGRSDGWHFAKAAGLPNREITGIAIDPKNPRTVYVTLAGYDRPWTDKGLGNQHGFGRGHVFKSTDAGQHFKNISKNLPNTDVWDVKLSGKRIVVGTDVGVFLSTGKSWSRLGTGLPNVWARSLAFKPNDSNLLIAAAYGRGVWAYRFGPPHKVSSGPKPVALHPAAATGAKIASFNFDTSAQGWTQTTNSAEQWRRQPPGDGSPFAFAVIPYIDASSAALTSPKLSVPKPSRGYNAQPITVTFSRLQSTEPGFDYLTVEWSSDGVRWTPAASGWSGMNPDFPQFSKTTVKFVAPAGALYIRFHLSSDELVSFPAYQGAAVDNVTVTR